jgi:uracil-DNA glycosylase
MMSREDLFRELELLPVWQLRNPVVGINTPETEAAVLPTEAEVSGNQQKSEASTYRFRLIVSEDGQWLFALKQQHSTEAETLFHNMLKAVNVKIGRDVAEAQTVTHVDCVPRVIVLMGEELAQQLLALSQSLVQLRGQPHTINNTPVIVTYAPDDLLQQVADKANAWEDLCLAKATVVHL